MQEILELQDQSNNRDDGSNQQNANQSEIIEKFRQVKQVDGNRESDYKESQQMYNLNIQSQRAEQLSDFQLKELNNFEDSVDYSNFWNHLVSRNDKEMNYDNFNSGIQFYYETQEDQTQKSKKDLLAFFQQVKTGSKCFTVTTIRDMSLWSALERQTNLSKYKSVAFAQAAHEFRNPLNAIINSIDLLKDFIHDETAQKYYSVAKNCSNLMGFLINDILDSCQIESHQNRLRQILINLLSNAIKYTNSGFVKFTAQVQDVYQQKFQIIIEDSGVGIEQSEIKCLFTEFNKILRKREMNKEGCGLGLTICQKLVRALGGQIHVESEINKGSKFIIDMPLIQCIEEITNNDFRNQDSQEYQMEEFKGYASKASKYERNIGDFQYSNNFNDDKYNLNHDEVDENIQSIDLNNFVCINRNDLRVQPAKIQFDDRSIFRRYVEYIRDHKY
eukprot:403350646